MRLAQVTAHVLRRWTACSALQIRRNHVAVAPISRMIHKKEGDGLFLGIRAFIKSYHRFYTNKRVNLVTPNFLRAKKYLDKVAIVDQHGSHLYGDMLHFAKVLSSKVANALGSDMTENCKAVEGERIAFLCPNDVSYTVAQWSVWMCGGIAVPLCQTHPAAQLEYYVQDCQCSLLLAEEQYADKLRPVAEKCGVKLLVLHKEDYMGFSDEHETNMVAEDEELPALGQDEMGTSVPHEDTLLEMHKRNKFKHKKAMIVYTSGTTGPPKGVVHTHGSLQAQVQAMVSTWGWSSNDVLLHVLPLHHVHGIVNCLLTPLYCGATCVMLPHFDASKVWSQLLSSVTGDLPRSVSVFMAVPTIYAKLIDHIDERLAQMHGARRLQEYIQATCSTKVRWISD